MSYGFLSIDFPATFLIVISSRSKLFLFSNQQNQVKTHSSYKPNNTCNTEKQIIQQVYDFLEGK